VRWRLVCACAAAFLGWAGVVASIHAQGLPPIVESTPYEEGRGVPPPLSESLPRPPPRSGALTAVPPPAAPAVVRSNLPVEERIARLERMVESRALVEILMRLEELQNSVQEIRGENEFQTHQVEGIKQRQRELYLDTDRRLRGIEVAVSAQGQQPPEVAGKKNPGNNAPVAAAIVGGGESKAGGTTPPSAVSSDSPEETAAYKKAFNVLKDGRYEAATDEFQKFLARYPTGQYSDNAQYWLAEANYVLRRFPVAIEEFHKVLVVFPDSAKIPDAMLKTGYSYYELKNWDETRKILNRLVKRFPDTTAAQLAKNRLHRMKLEGS